MALIFISHSSKDKDKSTEIKNKIEEAGFDSVFLDHDADKGIQTGQEWEQRLYDEIQSSHIMLLLLSPAWAESKWCFAEYTHAKSSGKKIIPLIIEQDSQENMTKWIVSYLQHSDITQNDTALEQVIEEIKKFTSSTQSGFEWEQYRSPYPGMISFEAKDAAIFFARDNERKESIELLNSMKNKNKPKSLMLVGASGMGKSSLLKAGILPNLKKYHQNEWTILPILTPSTNPLKDFMQNITNFLNEDRDYYKNFYAKLTEEGYEESIDDLLLDLSFASNLSMQSTFLLPIDQAENLYTTSEPKHRSLFIRLLKYLISHHKNFFILWTLRSDFLKDFQSDKEMRIIIEQNQIQTLTHIKPEYITDIIAKPAEIVGLKIEDKLIKKIQIDMQTSDALPLVSLALSELYEQHKTTNTPTITLATYQALSKDKNTNPLESIVQEKAEEAITDFRDKKSLKALKNAFIPHLVRIGEQGQYIKRVANWSELPKDSQDAITQLIEARLLIKYEDKESKEIKIEVSHEALLRKWSKLQEWLVDEKYFIIAKQNLEIFYDEFHNKVHKDNFNFKLLLSGIWLNKIWKYRKRITNKKERYYLYMSFAIKRIKDILLYSFIFLLIYISFSLFINSFFTVEKRKSKVTFNTSKSLLALDPHSVREASKVFLKKYLLPQNSKDLLYTIQISEILYQDIETLRYVNPFVLYIKNQSSFLKILYDDMENKNFKTFEEIFYYIKNECFEKSKEHYCLFFYLTIEPYSNDINKSKIIKTEFAKQYFEFYTKLTNKEQDKYLYLFHHKILKQIEKFTKNKYAHILINNLKENNISIFSIQDLLEPKNIIFIEKTIQSFINNYEIDLDKAFLLQKDLIYYRKEKSYIPYILDGIKNDIIRLKEIEKEQQSIFVKSAEASGVPP